MDNPSSPLDTLRQLKEMLDAGALTPAEFEALKQRLVFTAAPTPPVPPAAEPAAPTPATEPVVPTPATEPVVPAPAAPLVTPVPIVPVVPVPPPVFTAAPPAPPAASQYPEVEVVPLDFTLGGRTAPPAAPPRLGEEQRAEMPLGGFSAPAAPDPAPAPDADTSWVTSEFPEAEAPAARSPLMLILSIGGLLALLALVVYLSMNRPPSERLTSTSQTAADSVAAAIEVGPQAEPLSQTIAEPETIRVVPTNPAPALPARAPAPARDSAAAPAPASAAPPLPAPPDSSTNP